jgi:hypothetical protein
LRKVSVMRSSDGRSLSYPCERSEVRDRCTEQQLVVVDSAVYVVAIARRVITQRNAITIQQSIDDRLRGNDLHVVGAHQASFG